MMRVKQLVTCEYANQTADGRTNCLGIFDVMVARTLPGLTTPVILYGVIAAESTEDNASAIGSDLAIKCKIIGPDGTEIGELTTAGQLAAPIFRSLPAEANFVLGFPSLPLTTTGKLIFQIFVNGAHLGDAVISVVRESE